MDVVALLVRDPQMRTWLAHELSGYVHLRECGSPQRLLDFIRRERAAAVVAEVGGTAGAQVSLMIDTLRERHPSLPVVGIARPLQAELREILQAARAGISDVIVVGVSDAREVVRHVLAPADSGRAAEAVLSEIMILAPGGSWSILEYCVRHAKLGFSAKQLGAAMAISRSTLGRRMTRAGLPAPGTLLVWMRLLMASHLLEDGSRTVAVVAREVGFASEIVFRRSLKRLTGLRPSELRRPGAAHGMVTRFGRELLAETRRAG